MNRSLFVLIVCLACVLNAFSQQAELKITSGKNPRKVLVSLANIKGEPINTENLNPGLMPEEFQRSEQLYLFVEPFPKDEWTTFKEKMVQDELASVAILQGNLTIRHDGAYPALTKTDAKENITGILISFKKQMIDVTSEFSFVSASDTSDPVQIHERYWEGYDKYMDISKKGNKLFDQNKFLEAFNTLKVFITDTASVKGLQKFSFTAHNQTNILMNCAYMYSDSINRTFNFINYKFHKMYEEPMIASLDSLNQLMQKAQGFFAGYLNLMESLNDLKAKEIKELMARNSMDYDRIIQQNRNVLEKRKLIFLSRDSYDNFSFELYVDLITKMLLHCDSLKVIKGLDTLNISVLAEYYPEKYAELTLMKGWKESFEFLTRFINKTITRNKVVLLDSTIKRIEAMRSFQKQPYYEVLTAFNWLGQNNLQKFRQYLDTAMNTATDRRMLINIQNWFINLTITEKEVDYQLIQIYNEGLKYAEDDNFENAMTSFEKVLYISSKFAPVYYQIGLLYYIRNEGYTGEIRLGTSIQLDSTYISAWMVLLEKLYDSREFTRAEELVNKALKIKQLWVFYHFKARILEQLENLKKTDEGISIIDNQCIPRNKYNLDQYFSLADLYLKSNRKDKFEKATQIVLRTNELSVKPDPRFEEYMKKINEKKEAPASGKPY